jgi:hypothetical protein
MSNLYNPILVHFGLTFYSKSNKVNCRIIFFITIYFFRHIFSFNGLIPLLGLYITFCRLAMGGLFSTKFSSENWTFCYHKTVKRRRNPAYCQCAVSCCLSFRHFLFLNKYWLFNPNKAFQYYTKKDWILFYYCFHYY